MGILMFCSWLLLIVGVNFWVFVKKVDSRSTGYTAFCVGAVLILTISQFYVLELSVQSVVNVLATGGLGAVILGYLLVLPQMRLKVQSKRA